jgi:hypothetical protein
MAEKIAALGGFGEAALAYGKLGLANSERG